MNSNGLIVFCICFVTFCVFLFTLGWYIGLNGGKNPNPSEVQSRCQDHLGVAQIINRPWPQQNVRVVCRDGSVFDGKP